MRGSLKEKHQPLNADSQRWRTDWLNMITRSNNLLTPNSHWKLFSIWVRNLSNKHLNKWSKTYWSRCSITMCYNNKNINLMMRTTDLNTIYRTICPLEKMVTNFSMTCKRSDALWTKLSNSYLAIVEGWSRVLVHQCSLQVMCRSWTASERRSEPSTRASTKVVSTYLVQGQGHTEANNLRGRSLSDPTERI